MDETKIDTVAVATAPITVPDDTHGEFSSHVKSWQKDKDEKNDLDRFLILVFNSPAEKREYCEKHLGDPHINYIEGKYYSVNVVP